MSRLFWVWLARPLLSWLIVSLVILGIERLVKARQLAAVSAERALALPVGAKMAEVSFQVTRANGDKEPAQTYRTYKNPLRRWAWALKTAFFKGA